MIVEVQPVDSEGRPTGFDGALSLMLTAPNEDGGESSVARWDYRRQEVRAAVDPSDDSDTIRFHLELPSDSPAIEATKLWVRLVSRRSGKLLAYSAINVTQPGLFSSTDDGGPLDIHNDDAGVITAMLEAAADEDVSASHVSQTSATVPSRDIYDGGWTIAKPGQPAGLPPSEDEANSDWRASLEPPPLAMADSVAARPKPRVSRARESRPQREPSPRKVAKNAGWSPNRDATARYSRTADRPTWSANR
jgi:hypothetical protein